MPAKIRVATSGTHALADDYGNSAPTAGRVLTSLGAGLAPDWSTPAPGVKPIAQTLVVDAVNFSAVGVANGTLAAPFETIQEAIDAAVTRGMASVLLLIAPATYATPVAIPLSLTNVTFHGWDPTFPAILGGDITVTAPSVGNAPAIYFTNCTITAAALQTAAADQNIFFGFDHSYCSAVIAANDLVLEYQQSTQGGNVVANGSCSVRWDGPSWAYTLQAAPSFPLGTTNLFFDAGHDTYQRSLVKNGLAIGTTGFVTMAVNPLYVKQGDRVSIQVDDPAIQDFICGIHGVGVPGSITAWITNLSRVSTNFAESIRLLVHHDLMVVEPAP